MKYKVKLKTIKNRNNNDCWALALSKFLNTPYQDIYDIFEPLLDDGTLYKKFIEGYLQKLNYEVYDTNIYLTTAIQLHDNTRGILYIMEDTKKEFHAVYIKADTIYDTITRDMLWWYLKEYKVLSFAFKELVFE